MGVQRLIERGELPGADEIFEGKLGELSFTDFYDVTWFFFRFLAEGTSRDNLGKVLTKARQLGGGGDYADELLGYTRNTLGRGGKFKALDKAFVKYVGSLEPEWEQSYRSLDVVGDEWVQLAFPDTNAVAWSTAPVGKKNYTISGTLQILPGGNQQLNVLLDRGRPGTGNETFLSIAFHVGGVTAFLFDAEKETSWTRLGSISSTELAVGVDVAFEVTAKGSDVSISVAGKDLLTVTAQGRKLDGPFGVGAQRGSAGTWRGVLVD